MEDDSPNQGLITPEQVIDLQSEMRDAGVLGKDMIELLERGLTGKSLPKKLRSAKAGEAFQAAFELSGGTIALAIWAQRNQDKFYPLYARMITPTMAPVVAELPKADAKQLPEFPWLTAQRHLYKVAPAAIEDATDVSPKHQSNDEMGED